MNNWTFNGIEYRRPDMDAAIKAIQAHTQCIKNAKSGEEVIEAILAMSKESAEMEDMLSVAYIRNTLDTTDPFYEAEQA